MSTGIFDIIGPNMIGPSSSHTAGALRIAYLAGRLIHGGAKKVEFTLYGSFAHTYRGHGTDRALLAGVMALRRMTCASGIPSRSHRSGGCSTASASIPRPKYPTPIPLALLSRGRMALVHGYRGFLGAGACACGSWMGVEMTFPASTRTIVVSSTRSPAWWPLLPRR